MTSGPRDISELSPEELAGSLDLGGLVLMPADGVELQVQADEATGAIAQVTCVNGDGALQVHPYAAPRSGGMWDDVRGQIRSSINAGGGLVEEAPGPFGTELRAQVPGDGGLQPARFVGFDGPRWFLRAVFIGSAARDGETSRVLERALRGVAVRRGEHALPVGTPIELRLPGMQVATGAAERPRIVLPERGPEITETR